MKAKYSNNPLKELYSELSKYISKFINNEYNAFDKIDNSIKLMLMNNACSFVCDNEIYAKEVSIMDDDFVLYFIIGGIGNNINKFYDVIEINGMIYLVIFLDEFKDIIPKDINDNDNITSSAISFMGRFNVFESIVKLVNIFISLTSNPSIHTNILATTAVRNKYSRAPAIIAGSILSQYGELTESDVDSNLLEIINKNNIDVYLYGIYNIN